MGYTLITGASSGLGKELAILLAIKGHDLILIGRSLERLEETQIETNAQGVYTVVKPMDLSVQNAARDLHFLCIDYQVDYLILNAGASLFQDFKDLDNNTVHSLISLNLITTVETFSLFMNSSQEVRKEPLRVHIISSLAAEFPIPGHALYSASKAFLQSFAYSLHYELRNRNIKIFVSALGPMRTNFNRNAQMKPLKGIWLRISRKPEWVARQCVRQVQINRYFMVIGFRERWALRLSRLFPSSMRVAIADVLFRQFKGE